MKSCPYCSASNWDDTPVCYACGRTFPTPNAPPQGIAYTQPAGAIPAPDSSPTQPVFQRPSPPYGAQEPLPYPPPAQPVQPAYQAQYIPPAYAPYVAYPPADYVPPQPQPGALADNHRALSLLVLGLSVVLVLGCGLIFYALASSTVRGVQQTGATLSTQVAGVIPGLPAPADTPTPSVPEPTPYPTFTPPPAPVDSGEPAVQPTTEAFNPEKLLSPECASAVDHLSEVSKQLKDRPERALDATWRSGLENAVEQMRTSCGTLDEASPVPSLLGDAQQHLATAGTEFDRANQLFGEGVKELDFNKIVDAGNHFSQASKDLDQAIADIQKIGQ